MLTTYLSNDVRQSLEQFRRSVDHLFDNWHGAQPGSTDANGERTFSPVVETSWNEDSLNLRAILPGVAENDVRVSVQKNQLVIEGERKAPEHFEKNAYTQLAYGTFYTALTLPGGLDIDRVQCQLRNGILEIQLPLLEASKPKQIRIQTADERKAVNA